METWLPIYLVDLPQNLLLLPHSIQLLLVALVSGMAGSFINMAVWRIPRGESIVFARSHCPVCNHTLGIKDLIPLLSYLCLLGRCAYCKTHFGPRYFLIELFMVAWGTSTYFFLGPVNYALYLGFLGFFLVLALGLVYGRKFDRNLDIKRGGITYIEVMLALIIVAAVIIPFGNLFLSNYRKVIKNKEYIMAYNLLEEKMEELKLVPFSKLISDYELYAQPKNGGESIFVDEHIGYYHDLKSDEELFYKDFSDIQTEKHKLPDVIFRKFKKIYEGYYRWDYRLYPEDYEIFKRTVQVEPVVMPQDSKFERQMLEGAVPRVDLLKVTVTLWIDSQSNHRKLELSTYRRR